LIIPATGYRRYGTQTEQGNQHHNGTFDNPLQPPEALEAQHQLSDHILRHGRVSLSEKA
jgi:hypothetical protein